MPIQKEALQLCGLHSILLDQMLLDNRKKHWSPLASLQLVKKTTEHPNPHQIRFGSGPTTIWPRKNAVVHPWNIRGRQVWGDARWTSHWNSFAEHHGRSSATVWMAWSAERSWASEHTSSSNSLLKATNPMTISHAHQITVDSLLKRSYEDSGTDMIIEDWPW